MRSVFALSFAASFAAFTGFAAAQYTIDPESVAEPTRSYWCDQQIAMCPLICLQQPGVESMTTEANDCDSDQLTFECVCDNGIAPNLTQWSQTLPYFICQSWGQQCVKDCNGISSCQDSCITDHPCGAQTPYLGNATSSASGSSATPTGSATSTSSSIPITGFGGASPTSTSGNSNGAASVPYIPGATMSMAALFGSVFLGFAILL